jgi:tRNA 5-methylaminomethyl-2-thiouridine biosynthesis bifunctional protein
MKSRYHTTLSHPKSHSESHAIASRISLKAKIFVSQGHGSPILVDILSFSNGHIMPNPTPITHAALDWATHGPASQHFGDIYFSRDDGLAETDYVFIQGNHLAERFAQAERFTIAETGFGTGLNFLMSWQTWLDHAPDSSQLHYIAYEKFPLSKTDLQQALALFPRLTPMAESLIAEYPPALPGHHRRFFGNGRVRLTLIIGDALDHLPELDTPIDAWFLDGFAPAKNPDMWQAALFDAMHRQTKPGGSFATFTAASIVRRGLESAGFTIEKIKGYGRKRHMLKGSMPGNAPAYSALPKSACIIGAGLAGCSTARSLAERGINVTLLDQHPTPAMGASGNPLAARTPYFTVDWSARGQFYSNAYSYSMTQAAQLKQQMPEVTHDACGVITLARTPEQIEKQHKIITKAALPSEVALPVNAKDASELAGIPLPVGGIYYPSGGYSAMPTLCEALLQHPNIHTRWNTAVTKIQSANHSWQVIASDEQVLMESDILILTNSTTAAELITTVTLALEVVRGQLSMAPPTPATTALKSVINYGGYLTPALAGQHIIGSTYERHSDTTDIRKEDHQTVMNELAETLPELAETLTPTKGWANVRSATRDRMPLIGELAPNLYINTAHGSRGIHSCPFGGEMLASMITAETLPLSRQAQRAVDPLRFKDKMAK